MQNTNNINYKTAIFAGGCFWCMVSTFDILDWILTASIFCNAEDYHQNLYKTNPTEYKKDRSISGRDEFIQKYCGDNYYSIYEE